MQSSADDDRTLRLPGRKGYNVQIWRKNVSSTLLNHHLRRFDNDLNGIALLQSEFLGAIARNHAFDEIVPNLDDNVRHDIAHLDVLDRTRELISSG
jgi:hypothetical protein